MPGSNPDSARELPSLNDSDFQDAQPAKAVANSPVMKALAVGFLVLVLGGGAFFLFSSGSSSEASATAPRKAERSSAEPERALGIPLPVADEEASPISRDATAPAITASTSTPSAEPVAASHVEEFHEKLDRFSRDVDDRFSAMSGKIDDLSVRIDSLAGSVESLRKDDRDVDDDRLHKMEAAIAAIDEKLALIERRSRSNEKRLNGEAGSRYRGRNLPFRIESVDSWNGVPSVSVRSSGHRRFVSIGDVVKGWRLVAVDPTGSVRFEREGLQAIVRVDR